MEMATLSGNGRPGFVIPVATVVTSRTCQPWFLEYTFRLILLAVVLAVIFCVVKYRLYKREKDQMKLAAREIDESNSLFRLKRDEANNRGGTTGVATTNDAGPKDGGTTKDIGSKDNGVKDVGTTKDGESQNARTEANEQLTKAIRAYETGERAKTLSDMRTFRNIDERMNRLGELIEQK